MFRFLDQDRTIARMDTAAFADIIFLLLIFFLLSSSFILPGEIPVTPPESENAATPQEQPIVVTLTRDGEVYVDDEKIPGPELGTAIAARLNTVTDKSVVIRGDKSVDLGRLVEVMDAAKGAGAEKLALATRKKPGR